MPSDMIKYLKHHNLQLRAGHEILGALGKSIEWYPINFL